MIKEKIKTIIDNKYFNFALVLVINIFFFIICNKLFTPKYEQVDDFIIMNLISKMDGKYTIYGVQMHPIICGIIILLYQTGININWYTIFMLSMQFISFTIIGTIFINKRKILGISLYIVFMVMMYSKVLSYIQYTTVSMLCITAGFILLMDSIGNLDNINKRKLIIAIIIFSIGCMIRFSTIIIAAPFIALYFICKIIKEKNIKVLKIASIFIIILFIIYISFNIIYKINPMYRKFLEFHDARTYLHDYNWMSYNNNEEIFNKVNWSKNDRDIFYAYCFGDEEVFNSKALENLEYIALSKKSNINIGQKIITTFEEFTNSIKNRNYKYIFLVTAILLIFNNLAIIINKSNNQINDTIKITFINFCFLSIIAMHCLFIFLNRPMFRVVISIYIIGITILMYILLEENRNKPGKLINCFFITLILFISILEFEQNVFYASYYNKENYSVYKEILEYTNSRKENAYLYTLVIHDRYLAYSVYEKIEDNTLSNIRPLGDWDTYTVNYYDFKERYHIDNLIESLYKNDNVYLISGDVIWGESYKEYINIIVKYINEHYGVQVNCNVIKEFRNNIKIYKLEEI